MAPIQAAYAHSLEQRWRFPTNRELERQVLRIEVQIKRAEIVNLRLELRRLDLEERRDLILPMVRAMVRTFEDNPDATSLQILEAAESVAS